MPIPAITFPNLNKILPWIYALFRLGWDIFWTLFCNETLLLLIGALGFALLRGYALTSYDIFHLFWFNNAGVPAGLLRNLYIGCGGFAATFFWCVWITLAYLLLKHREELQQHSLARVVRPLANDYETAAREPQLATETGQSAAAPQSRYTFCRTLFWLSILPVCSFAPVLFSDEVEYADSPSPFFDRLPFIVGILIVIIIFWAIRRQWALTQNQFSAPPSRKSCLRELVPTFLATFPLGTLVLGGLMAYDLWLLSWALAPTDLLKNDDPVIVAFFWLLFAFVISIFECLGNPDYELTRRQRAIQRFLIWVTLFGTAVTFFCALSPQCPVPGDRDRVGWFLECIFLCCVSIFGSLAALLLRRRKHDAKWRRKMRHWFLWIFVGTFVLVAVIYDAFDWKIESYKGCVWIPALLLSTIAILSATWIVPFEELTPYEIDARRVGVLKSLINLIVARYNSIQSISNPASASWHQARPIFYASAVFITTLMLTNLLRDDMDNARFCWLPGSISIFVLLAALALLFGWLSFVKTNYKLGLLGFLLIIVAFLSWNAANKNHPNPLIALENYYERPLTSLPLQPDTNINTDQVRPQLQQYGQYRAKRLPGQIDDKSEDWLRNRWPIGHSRKPPIVVTTSGGASASAIFTVKVLSKLEEAFPGFSSHVCIMTGASGGMFGAAYFRSQLPLLTEYGGREDGPRVFGQMNERIRRDFLSPIVQQIVFKDLPWSFVPVDFFRYDYKDRGQRLEQAWSKYLDGALDVTFESLAEQEKVRRLPSLIFTPILKEDSRQLLISTLDLDHLIDPGRLDHIDDDGIRRLSGVEFFKLFPNAFAKLQLSTAVRLSASFAWLSPSANLPTVPPRSVLDAGYMDNHGILIASQWLNAHKSTLIERTSKVIILSIRVWDHFEAPAMPPITSSELTIFRENKTTTWPRRKFSADEVSSPLSGLKNVNEYGTMYRNDRALKSLKNLFGPSGDFQGLSHLTIIGDVDELPLNWTISTLQANRLAKRIDDSMEKALNSPVGKPKDATEWNAQQFRLLLDWLAPNAKE